MRGMFVTGKSTFGYRWLLLSLLGVTAGCSSGDGQHFAGATQALNTQNDTPLHDSSVVFKRSADDGICHGVLMTKETSPDRSMILTSRACATDLADEDPILVRATTAAADVQLTASPTIVDAGPTDMTSLVIIEGQDIGGAEATVAAAVTPTVAFYGFDERTTYLRLGRTDSVTLTAGSVTGLLCPQTNRLNSGLDEGIGAFDDQTGSGSNLVGIATNIGSPQGCGTALANVLSFDQFPQAGFGVFDPTGSNIPYTYVLGGDGLVYELMVIANGKTVVVDTGIPKLLPGLYPSNPLPQVVPGADRITVNVGGGMQGSDPADGSTDVDFTVEGEDPTPPLRHDLGMSFIVRSSDILDGKSWKGMPSAYESDGRFLVIGGTGFGTASASNYRAYLNCEGVTTPEIEVYDANVSGQLDKNDDENPAKTCIFLATTGALNSDDGQCRIQQGTLNEGTSEEGWQKLTVGDSTCTAGRYYHLGVFLAQDGANCNALDLSGAQAPNNAFNSFKVRTNCQLANANNFSFIGADSTKGIITSQYDFVPSPDSDYDQVASFTYAIDTGRIENPEGNPDLTRFHLRNADADDCGVDNCVTSELDHTASGQGHGIHFLGFGSSALLPISDDMDGITWPAAGQTFPPAQLSLLDAALKTQNPSGHFDGPASAGDPGVGDFTVTFGNEDRVLLMWRNVRPDNNVHLVGHTGQSPILYPTLSNTSVWLPITTVGSPAAWAADPAELALYLPVVVGKPGALSVATTVAEAQALLSGDTLLAKLTAAKLNAKRTLAIKGIRSEDGVVRRTETLVAEVIADAEDALASGSDPSATTIALLDGINEGQILFENGQLEHNPEANDDDDTLLNGEDNCPVVTNEDQANTFIVDDLGDACDPEPIVECVVERGPGQYTAFFGYNNPYIVRRVAGEYNYFDSAPADRGQPTLQLVGRHHNVFSVDFDGSPVTWTLGGYSATASSSTERCIGTEITQVSVNDRVALLAENRLELGQRVTMPELDAVAAGLGGILVGSDAVLGDVSSEGDVVLEDRAAVAGLLEANGSITEGYNVKVAGTVSPAAVSVDDIGLTYPPPGTVTELDPIPPDGILELAPGDYGALVVGDRGRLVLTGAGEYTFASLQVNNDAVVEVNDTSGLVRVIVQGSLAMLSYGDRNVIESTSGGHPQLLLVYLGTQTARIQSPFAGSILAPNATLDLVRGSHAGTFFAENVIVGNEVQVTYVALDN